MDKAVVTEVNLVDPTLLKSQCYVDGAWVGEGEIDVTNPASGAVIGRVPRFGADETTKAVDAAAAAFKPWGAKTAKERSKLIRQWYERIMAHRDDLALILTSEQGKPLAEALGEIDYAASYIEFYAEEAKRIAGETLPSHRADARILVLRQPTGVVGAITPWNFPAAMITRKAAPALAAGCTVVLKPAGETPLTALALAELADRAGIPKGVFNVVTGESRGDRRRADLAPRHPAREFHRLDRGRQDADAPGGRHGEEGRAGARRQCAVHRVRRRGP